MAKTQYQQDPLWRRPRSLKRCLGPVLALLLAPLAAYGAPNSTTLNAGQKIDFGTFSVLPSCSNCSITIAPTGARTKSGGVILSSTNNGKAGTFTVGCNNGVCAYSATITGSPTIVAGSVTMTVGSFTQGRSSPNTPSTLMVGAKLTIPSQGASAGTRTSGTYSVTTTTP